MDRMTSMATFVKVVESGGFSAAARTLGMSPSMVTAHVQSLEERLGVRLLNRSTRRVSLTEVGHAYYERCSQVLADVVGEARPLGAWSHGSALSYAARGAHNRRKTELHHGSKSL